MNNTLTFFEQFTYSETLDLFEKNKQTVIEDAVINKRLVKKFVNEFWTAKQRQAHSLHEVSYRACFKPQLPRFFIENFTNEGDIVYDPFTGRGTTIIEAALLKRNVISNDINPISLILCKSRLFIPDLHDLKLRLDSIKIWKVIKPDIELDMFFHKDTFDEIISIKNYLLEKEIKGTKDGLDNWIQMVATNRLTGHSSGFFSVYTLPPNQAVSKEGQKKINEKRKQVPEYRNTKEIILKKSKQLLKDITIDDKINLKQASLNSIFLNNDARSTPEIGDEVVKLTVTSPPFLDVVQYADDNWLRCWFNDIDANAEGKKITMSRKITDWENVMNDVFKELYRITKGGGYVAFEVGEVRNGKIKLDEHVVELGINNGFSCEGIMINEQIFTKTANIWGVSNNDKGTNTNRIVLFKK